MNTFLKVLITILLIISTSIQSHESLNLRVIGGQKSQSGQFPFMASLWYLDDGRCGASIIAKNWVLTAGHCVRGISSPSVLKVIVGTTTHSSGGNTHNVANIKVHPKFDHVTLTNDIALIKVTPEFKYNSYVQPIKLGKASINETCTLLGWGVHLLENHHSHSSNELQFVNLRISSLKGDKICIDSKNKGFCFGDSGGPLIAKGKLIGIVSNGIPCARGFPDLYTRVYLFKNWIRQIIWEDVNYTIIPTHNNKGT